MTARKLLEILNNLNDLDKEIVIKLEDELIDITEIMDNENLPIIIEGLI